MMDYGLVANISKRSRESNPSASADAGNADLLRLKCGPYYLM